MARVFSSSRLWIGAALLVSLVLPYSRAADVRTDLDGDISRDGVIDDDDPRDNGYVQNNPPGLPVTVGALEKLALRCTPKSVAKGYVRLSVVSGPEAWKAAKNPRWRFRPRPANGGHIRVWKDPGKTTLVLDSHDLAKQTILWRLSYNSPMAFVPLALYVEGMVASKNPGDVVLALEYGPVASAAKSTRDILVATVTEAAKAPLVRADIRKDGPSGRGGRNAEQLAIWCFESSPSFANRAGASLPVAATTEDVVGSPTFTMINADIDPNGKDGTSYTDVEGVAHPTNTATDQAAAWNDVRKSNAPDAEFRVAIATTGWQDIWFRFNYKSESTTTFRLQYSLGAGTQWGNAFVGTASLTADNFTNWHAFPDRDLTGLDAIEDHPAVLFRFYDFKQFGNGKLAFDNLEFYGTRVPPPGPSIRVAPTTTAYLSLEPANEGYVSGVISDPTDPARTLGIDFTIADPDTPVNQLTVTTAIVPAGKVQVALSGTGGQRNLKITPTSRGYADINVKVSDGVTDATYVIRYAASAAAPNPAGPRFHTGVSDISAATAIDANTMLTANDEDRSLWLYHRGDSGLFVKEIDTTTWPGLPTQWLGLTTTRETDIEGCARDGSRAYWIGSHGNNSSGKIRLNRHRLFATTISGSGSQATVAPVGWYEDLRTDLIAWDVNDRHGKGANYYGLMASAAPGVWPKQEGGFNIEGLAMGSNSATVYVGFRAPMVPAPIVPAPIPPVVRGTKALVVPVTNVQALVNGSPSTGPATFGPPIELDLGGRGVRSMARTASGGYLIVAGPTTNATGTPPSDFRLYSWSGNPLAAPALLQNDLTGLSTGGSFEAIVEPVGGVTGDIELLNDNGTTNWYGDGAASKTLKPNWQKFRSDRVTPGAPVPAAPFSMTMGGAGDDAARSAVHTLDGGSIVAGCTSSTGAGKLDLWVCKLDGSGNVEWQKTYGGAEDDCTAVSETLRPPCIRQALDGGYIVATSTATFGAGETDVWVLRLASDGGIVWQKTYGGKMRDEGIAVAVCSDGNFVVGCNTASFRPEESRRDMWDMWILKLRANGTILWQSVCSRRSRRRTLLEEIEETPGGELLVAGRGRYFQCLLKLSPTGALRWAIDCTDIDYRHAAGGAQPTNDGGCMVGSGYKECRVEKIDRDGKTVWRKSYVGSGKIGEDQTRFLSRPTGIDETPDGGYIIGTIDHSIRKHSAHVPAPANQVLLRVDSNGNPVWCRSYESMGKGCDSLTACPDGTYLMAGMSEVSKATGRDMLILKVKADGTVPGFDTPLFPVNVTDLTKEDRGGSDHYMQPTTVIGINTDITPANSLISPTHVRD